MAWKKIKKPEIAKIFDDIAELLKLVQKEEQKKIDSIKEVVKAKNVGNTTAENIND